MAFAIVALAAASAGVLHVVAYYGRRPVLAGATKALPILILLGWVLASSVVVSPVYRTFVAVGLAFGMGGDLLLLSPTRFRAGLASFFVGHVAYLLAFTVGSPPFGAVWWAAGLIVLVAGELLRRLWPHVRSERVPVAAYVVVIALMAWTAVARALDDAFDLVLRQQALEGTWRPPNRAGWLQRSARWSSWRRIPCWPSIASCCRGGGRTRRSW